MKFVKHFMATCRRNRITKIGTARGLAFALSSNGGMKNVMVQVVNTDKDRVAKIEKNFEIVVNGFKEYFTCINHVYFPKPDYTNVSDNFTAADLEILTMIKDMKFSIGVQSYSNINRIVMFNVDMSKGKDQVTPEQVVLDEIHHTLNSSKNNDGVSSTNNNEAVATKMDETLDAVTTLLELSTHDKELESMINRDKQSNKVSIISTDPKECEHDFIMQRNERGNSFDSEEESSESNSV